MQCRPRATERLLLIFPMSENEILLSGGNVNTGVVRVGNTVRRAMTPASPTIHRLLLHLEAKGFAGSPRFLGVDRKGREKLSFLEGETGIPPAIWQSDEPLIAGAKLLRRYHDATLDFVQSDADVWAERATEDKRQEVICHNDFAPYNFVYATGLPWGVIDFDLAGPGPRACGMWPMLRTGWFPSLSTAKSKRDLPRPIWAMEAIGVGCFAAPTAFPLQTRFSR